MVNDNKRYDCSRNRMQCVYDSGPKLINSKKRKIKKSTKRYANIRILELKKDVSAEKSKISLLYLEICSIIYTDANVSKYGPSHQSRYLTLLDAHSNV